MYTKHTKEKLELAVTNSYSYAQVLKALGLRDTGGNRQNLKHNLEKHCISVDHFTGQAHNRGKKSASRVSPNDLLVLRPDGSRRVPAIRLRKALIELGVEYICRECSQGPIWNNKPLTLHVDHIDGNSVDCRLENLRFLCPHCHSQQETSTSWRYTDRPVDSRTCECGKGKLSRSSRCLACYSEERAV